MTDETSTFFMLLLDANKFLGLKSFDSADDNSDETPDQKRQKIRDLPPKTLL